MRSVISIKLLYNFIEITLRHGCSSVNLLYIFKTLFPKNICRGLLLRGLFRTLSEVYNEDFLQKKLFSHKKIHQRYLKGVSHTYAFFFCL